MTEGKLMMIVRRISIEYQRAVASGQPPAEAEQTAFLVVSAEFAGERVYVAGLPKAQRARQLAKLQRQSTREVAAASGLPLRTVQRLLNGK
jgi:DNA-directed RNA polymerase specialized sigma24 family protein